MPDDKRWLKSTVNDLNNFLQEVSGYVDLAWQNSPVTSEAFGYLQSSRSSIDRASATVQKILSHLEDGGGMVLPSVVPAARPVMPARDPAATAGLPIREFKSQEVADINGVSVTNPNGLNELILVVDDEMHVMLLAQMMLADQGYRVVTAKDGFEALDHYRKLGKQIDLVILDFTMPGMHGDQVFDELRKINPDVAVVLSSGFADQTKLNRMFAQGLREFIAKPYNQQRLLSEIRAVLGPKKS